MRILVGITLLFFSVATAGHAGEHVVNDPSAQSDFLPALEECLSKDNAVWAQCFAEFGPNDYAHDPEKNVPEKNGNSRNSDYYLLQLSETLGLPAESEGAFARAVAIWTPNPYAAAIEQYISGDALKVGDSLLTHVIPHGSLLN